jgi:hypothetical protein
MSNPLNEILTGIAEKHRDQIGLGTRFYLEENIGKLGAALGHAEAADRFKDTTAIVPLKAPVPGMKVRIDGRTFVNYAQLDTGVAIPGYVVRETMLPHKPFVPNDSMILNFA